MIDYSHVRFKLDLNLFQIYLYIYALGDDIYVYFFHFGRKPNDSCCLCLRFFSPFLLYE